MKTLHRLRHFVHDASGQALVEVAIVAPILVVLALGVVEFGNVLFDQHVVTKLTREGSNLISRDATLGEAAAALAAMSSGPVDFSSRSKVIFSVLKKGATPGTSNYDKVHLYQRYEFGAGSGSSRLSTAGGGSFTGAPDYMAVNADNSPGLRVTNVPSDLITTRGGLIYVTEIFTEHDLLTPLGNFGISIPTTLYSIAYF